MLPFRPPEISDKIAVTNAVTEAGYMGSDASFANIYLLRKKYGTQIALQQGFLFRYYNGVGSRRGYAFPLGAGDSRAALALIAKDAHESARPLEFCLVDEPRAQILRDYFGEETIANGAAIRFAENRGDSDYLYSAESLANLPGTTYRKKRNHVSRFNRTYANYELQEINRENVADALQVEKLWMNSGIATESSEHACEPSCECEEAAWAERSEDEKSRFAEYCAIEESLKHFEALGMRGAILYVQGKPVGMTMASQIIPGVWDIHFEKVIGEYANNGGYAIINKLFTERLVTAGAKLINREEDIGIEGLRKAKLSYYPLTILDKMHATYHPCTPHCHPGALERSDRAIGSTTLKK